MRAEHGVPRGVIVMWSGKISEIPSGWALCNGSNGTPDLRDKFIVGANQDSGGITKTNVSGELTQQGGEAYHTLTIDEMPTHTHSYSTFGIEGGNNSGGGYPEQQKTSTTASTGGSKAHNNLPPYYTLAFIMKL